MKKDKLLGVVLLVCFIFALGGCAKREISNINSRGKNIICFGDSITFGYGVNKGEDYPTALSKILNLPVINAGIDGDTSIQALIRLESDVLSKDPRLVIVEFCGNDFIKGVPKEQTFKNIKEVIERIQAKGIMVALVDISAGFFLVEYRGEFEKIAGQTHSIFIPQVLNGIVNNPSMKYLKIVL